MHFSSLVSFALALAVPLVAGLDEASLTKYTNSLTLDFAFKPVKESYWTGFPHHRRTPFAVSPDGASAYIAYLDSSETDVHIQKLNIDTFAADGAAVTVAGAKEAGGLVAHNDGFALLTNEALPSGTANAPAGSTPVPVLYRFTDGKQTWKTFLGGPGVHASDGLSASPDLNGDLVYSETAKLYGAYFVVTDYQGWAAGHFGDSVQYVGHDGKLQTIAGASSSWGCSHNTGIAFEAADAAPFASICAEDQGEIWLNTKTQGMSGVKISNENTTNGGSGEPMGGMSGSYSGLARFQNSDAYIFAWVSRGAINLHANEWLGGENTQAYPRTSNRNVAIAIFSDKYTLDGPAAITQIGAASGDDQINWATEGTADRSNAHVATFDGSNALVTWEEIASPTCNFVAMGCSGTFSGSFFQQVDKTGAKVGEALKSTDTYVAGDMVTLSDGRICWPYVDMAWSLDARASKTVTSKSISFACMSIGGGSSIPSNSTQPATSSVTSTRASVGTGTVSTGSVSLTSVASITSAVAIPSSTPSTIISSSAPIFANSTTTTTRGRSSRSRTTAAATSKTRSRSSQSPVLATLSSVQTSEVGTSVTYGSDTQAPVQTTVPPKGNDDPVPIETSSSVKGSKSIATVTASATPVVPGPQVPRNMMCFEVDD